MRSNRHSDYIRLQIRGISPNYYLSWDLLGAKKALPKKVEKYMYIIYSVLVMD